MRLVGVTSIQYSRTLQAAVDIQIVGQETRVALARIVGQVARGISPEGHVKLALYLGQAFSRRLCACSNPSSNFGHPKHPFT